MDITQIESSKQGTGLPDAALIRKAPYVGMGRGASRSKYGLTNSTPLPYRGSDKDNAVTIGSSSFILPSDTSGDDTAGETFGAMIRHSEKQKQLKKMKDMSLPAAMKVGEMKRPEEAAMKVGEMKRPEGAAMKVDEMKRPEGAEKKPDCGKNQWFNFGALPMRQRDRKTNVSSISISSDKESFGYADSSCGSDDGRRRSRTPLKQIPIKNINSLNGNTKNKEDPVHPLPQVHRLTYYALKTLNKGNPVCYLKELCELSKLHSPNYAISEAAGGIQTIFICRLDALGLTAEGKAFNKKEAKQRAGAKLLVEFGRLNPNLGVVCFQEYLAVEPEIRDMNLGQEHGNKVRATSISSVDSLRSKGVATMNLKPSVPLENQDQEIGESSTYWRIQKNVTTSGLQKSANVTTSGLSISADVATSGLSKNAYVATSGSSKNVNVPTSLSLKTANFATSGSPKTADVAASGSPKASNVATSGSPKTTNVTTSESPKSSNAAEFEDRDPVEYLEIMYSTAMGAHPKYVCRETGGTDKSNMITAYCSIQVGRDEKDSVRTMGLGPNEKAAKDDAARKMIKSIQMMSPSKNRIAPNHQIKIGLCDVIACGQIAEAVACAPLNINILLNKPISNLWTAKVTVDAEAAGMTQNEAIQLAWRKVLEVSTEAANTGDTTEIVFGEA